MTNNPRFVYWDSCVFLSYVNGPVDRTQTIETLWDDITENKGAIYTSSLTLAEVAYVNFEKKDRSLDPDIEEKINSIWDDTTVMVIELHQEIARIARGLMRSALPNSWVLKPNDAIHLATASWINNAAQSITEFHTYDESLDKYGTMIGIQICKPHIIQARLINR